jgi:SPP1 gp7 family putative phage head morphogenesis protein
MPELTKKIVLEPLPFEEAIAFFADKISMTANEFYSLANDMRARAFTVARVWSMDVIMDIQNAVETAVDTGETLADFQGRLDDIMAARGWEGLTPWHAETVFRNNIQTAYSVGRWNQMQDMSDKFYGEYDAVNDSHTRPTHAALDGKIFPLDHPFWDTWWPPNGHR